MPGWSADASDEAWPAFLAPCRARPAGCLAARLRGGPRSGRASGASAARGFFESRFMPWRVVNPDGSREGLVTGYYEPLIKGSRSRSKTYPWPVLGVPDDLLGIDLGDVFPELKGQRLRGRLVGHKVVPYYSRAEVARLSDKFAGKAILYAEDAVELFFLQVQGSGRVQMPDGSVVRLAYADTNGHPYQSTWPLAGGQGRTAPRSGFDGGHQELGAGQPRPAAGDAQRQSELHLFPRFHLPVGRSGPLASRSPRGGAWPSIRAAFRSVRRFSWRPPIPTAAQPRVV